MTTEHLLPLAAMKAAREALEHAREYIGDDGVLGPPSAYYDCVNALAALAATPKPLLAGRIAELAHRICTEYRHGERVKYGFTEMNLLDFAWAIEREVLDSATPKEAAPAPVVPALDKMRHCSLGCLDFGQCKATMHGVPRECSSPSADRAAAPQPTIVQKLIAEREAKAQRVAALPAGTCPECEGVGYFESALHFSDCEDCGGTGETKGAA